MQKQSRINYGVFQYKIIKYFNIILFINSLFAHMEVLNVTLSRCHLPSAIFIKICVNLRQKILMSQTFSKFAARRKPGMTIEEDIKRCNMIFY